MSNNDSRRTSSTGFMPSVGTGAGVGYSGFVTRNMVHQSRALNGGSVNPASRLGALQATSHFGPNTVGSGAHNAIRAIHSLMGNVGQSNIGTLFRSAQVQGFASQSIRSAANNMLASAEHGFWTVRRGGIGANGASTMGERFGGVLGSAVQPNVRAAIQTGFSAMASAAPRVAARAPGVAGVVGGLAVATYSHMSGSTERM